MDLKKLIRGSEEPLRCTAVVLAAGNSTRMGQDKAVMMLRGLPVIVRTLHAFDNHPMVDEIIVVTRADMVDEISAMRGKYGITKLKKVLIGGASRAESSLIGVSAVDAGAKYIAIHDGARPLVSERVITETLTAARDYHAAVPAIPSADSLRLRDGDYLGEIINRDAVVLIQTPQIFDADLIKGALTYAVEKKLPITDDSSALAYTGFRVKITAGDKNNIKLTTPEDVIVAEAILREGQAE